MELLRDVWRVRFRKHRGRFVTSGVCLLLSIIVGIMVSGHTAFMVERDGKKIWLTPTEEPGWLFAPNVDMATQHQQPTQSSLFQRAITFFGGNEATPVATIVFDFQPVITTIEIAQPQATQERVSTATVKQRT